ncbi:MAG TPA: S9 family peptidase [Pyrinomonadaceae bacterium]|nr:S9 family peptidase [Pyrinomonadaceae bacterium]
MTTNDSTLPTNATAKARRAASILFAALLALAASGAHAQTRQSASGGGKQKRATQASAPRDVKRYTIEQFMNTVRVGGSSFSPDERSVLFHSNRSGIFNVYSVPVAGGEARALTDSKKESTYVVSYFPEDARFLYTYDRGGNENSHIYLRDEAGRERDLTPGDRVKARFLGWNRDRKSFYYSTNERDARFFDVFEMTIATMTPRLIYKDETGFEVADISNDRNYIALQRPGVSASDADIYIYDLFAKQLKHITPHNGEVNHSPEVFDPESKYLYYLTDAGSEFQYVARYDLRTGKTETVEKHPWDVMFTYFSRNGRYRVTATNEDARTVIRIRDTRTDKLVPLPKLPDGDITGVSISPSERLMAFYHNGDRSPSNLYVYDFQTRKATRLTNTLNPEIDPADLVEAEVVRYKSFDGTEIPAILYRPHGASAAQKVPAVVSVHGGPGGQARKGYNARVQFLVNHGYAVIDVNNRGSSGYGKTFFSADDGRHGREPLWDVVEAKKFLQTRGWVEPERIGIMGGSYGGYMVLAALAFKPEEFAVGVNIFGVSNWVRTLQSIPPYWESFRKTFYRELGDPSKEKDLENLRAISPLFHADKIRRPLIVLQGANDPRVIKVESDEIVEAVKRNGVTVEYVVFDDEGHGFTKKANELRANKAILDFLDKHLNTASAAQGTRDK